MLKNKLNIQLIWIGLWNKDWSALKIYKGVENKYWSVLNRLKVQLIWIEYMKIY